ncbi:MAG: class I SAM-dependent methyltransferase [Verrucomicrobiota bacterium]
MEKALTHALPVNDALDVGCGTGHSTVALLPYAHRIVGIDPSSAMRALAPLHPKIEYRKGHAEALPFRDSSFDLVTVGSAYHWFDHERFLDEARRVLRPQGWLVLYKVGSMGRIDDRPDFERWRRGSLRARYPKVERNSQPLTPEVAAQFGFTEIACEAMERRQCYNLEAYVENLMTHSSVIRVVDSGRESVSAARDWLREELAPFFADGEAEFTHEAGIHILQKKALLELSRA